MLSFKLAYKNLVGAGLRTWLNVFILSLSFVMIIWFKGMLDGWDREAKTDTIAWEAGGGQYWQENYDPNDPFSLTESYSTLSDLQQQEIAAGNLVPVLITRGTLYPRGRMQNILIKGIQKEQEVLKLPTHQMDTVTDAIPAIIGSNMATSIGLKKGDFVTMRWRDANGTFDADEIIIAGVFSANVPSVDAGQVWIPLERLQGMMMLSDAATILIRNSPPDDEEKLTEYAGWEFKDRSFLLQEIDRVIKSKSAGSSVFYVILLLLAMLAIFDTQVLSVFRRQKEIGTYIAMGMTRRQVVSLFTVEGAMHAILAIALGAVYGIPLFIQQAKQGINFGMDGADFGMAMAETLYPLYTIELVISTILIVTITTTFVSFLPARKISKMKPTEAIKGKIQ